MSSFIKSIIESAGTKTTTATTVTVEANHGRYPRTNYIKFTTENGASDIVTVKQKAGNEELNLIQTKLEASNESPNVVISGSTNSRTLRLKKSNNNISYTISNLKINGVSTNFTDKGDYKYYAPEQDSKVNKVDLGKTGLYTYEIFVTFGKNEYATSQSGIFYVYSYTGQQKEVAYEVAANAVDPSKGVSHVKYMQSEHVVTDNTTVDWSQDTWKLVGDDIVIDASATTGYVITSLTLTTATTEDGEYKTYSASTYNNVLNVGYCIQVLDTALVDKYVKISIGTKIDEIYYNSISLDVNIINNSAEDITDGSISVYNGTTLIGTISNINLTTDRP